MAKEKFDYIITAAKELQASSIETNENLKQFIGELKETRDLYALEKDTSKSPLLSLGITLFILPDPISTPIGAGMILFGLAQQKINGQPLYVKDLYEIFNQNVIDLMKDSNLLSMQSDAPCVQGLIQVEHTDSSN